MFGATSAYITVAEVSLEQYCRVSYINYIYGSSNAYKGLGSPHLTSRFCGAELDPQLQF